MPPHTPGKCLKLGALRWILVGLWQLVDYYYALASDKYPRMKGTCMYMYLYVTECVVSIYYWNIISWTQSCHPHARNNIQQQIACTFYNYTNYNSEIWVS